MFPLRVASKLMLAVCLLCATVLGQEGKPSPLPTIAAKTTGLAAMPGYLPLYWDERNAKLWLVVDKWETEFLYLDSLPAGMGSNDIGLDRGQLGETRVVKFQRSGNRVLLTQLNYEYRAGSDNPAERRSVEEAFAQSVLWGFEAAAEDPRAGNSQGAVLVDATSFFLNDVHDVAGVLKRTRQGNFRLEPTRSAIYLPATRNFPRNTEVEAVLTFLADDPGPWVEQVTPTARAVTVRERHSLIQLPDPGYRPRAFDPRSGFGALTYQDYATRVDEPLTKRLIVRHRLEKSDKNAGVSEPVKPIVYYLDPGTPEPVRSALLEGARWWNQAFEAAGYKNAFRVEMLPEGADPMDVRYNVIQWVHRATRGWSYGASVVDPRTGEIIKGHVTLGSLRVRQDFLIAEGLLAPYEHGKPADPRMLQMALARLRQLAAHEVGHTLGLAHNYIASAQGRASVMDYPHPDVRLGGKYEIDLSHAYAQGIGEWDKVAIDYGYREFPQGANEAAALVEILDRARVRGLTFLTDQDARPPGSSHPMTHLWDNERDAVAELEGVLRIRAQALEAFGENNIRAGAPLATLEEVLVPIYLFHRYQAEAAVKVIGGLTYTYALRDDGQKPTETVPAAEQRRALAALLKTLSPDTLVLPDRIVRLIPPRPFAFQRHRELFRGNTGATFDPVAAAGSAAHLSVGLLLNPERAERLVQQHSRDPRMPGFADVLDRLLSVTWRAPRRSGYPADVQRMVDTVVLHHLLDLAADDTAATQVRALASLKLAELRQWLGRAAARDEATRAHFRFAAAQIAQFERDPKSLPRLTKPPEPPPGAPIGVLACDWE